MNPTRSRSGKGARALAFAVACFLTGEAGANPAGAEVVAGQVDFVSSPNQLLITNSPGAIINWKSFSILPGELTQFIQQSSSSSVLNRVTGQDPTQILGALRSNGKVVLINPNGILFGAGSRVDVNGLVASSLDLSDADFLAGRLRFSDSGRAGAVGNHGAITTPDGGQVYLIGSSVSNGGVITSPNGDVVLAAGQSVDLADSGNPDVRVVLSAPGSEALNVGKVVAEAGRVGIYGALVNQMGLVSADSAVVGANGKIVLKSSGDTILGAGSVTSATGAGRGGVIEATGTRVGLTGDALVDASGQTGGGAVLIGGGEHGDNPSIQNAELTYVGAAARVRADALEAGDGGKVVVWSDRQTRAYGNLSARGGSSLGNGGFVETSSKGYLDYRGIADLRAPSGLAGTLLLDPSDITIQPGTSTGDVIVPSAAPFDITAANATSMLSIDDLQNALSLGNVTISTSSNASAPLGGNITVAAPLSWSNANALSLLADHGIAINAPLMAPGGTLNLRAGSGDITQGAPITAAAVTAIATSGSVQLVDPNNSIALIAGGANGPMGFALVNSNGFTVGTVPGFGATAPVSGITSTFGSSVYGVVLQAPTAGDITIAAPVNGGTSGVLIGASGGGVVQGVGGLISGRSLIVNADGTGGVGGSAAPLLTAVGTLKSANSAGGVYLDNSGDLTISYVNAAGAVGVKASGSLVTSIPTACDCVSAIAGSSVALAAEGSMLLNAGATLSATNDVTLRAGYDSASGTYSSTDKTLTVDGSVSGSTIGLFAAGAITASGTLTGAVTQTPSLGSDPSGPVGPVTPPTLAECIATPSLAGCGAVLPTLAACTASPSTAGCSAVLPTLAACTADPTAAGCSAVLPTLSACTTSPATAGCNAVLPTLAACTADPTAAGCSAVLPTLAACTTSPATAGCSAVLPTLAACVSNPAASGCSVILPTLSACTAWPTTAGCTAVLPTLAQCTVAPSLAGCSVVLPPVSVCASNPSAAGCAVVMPPSQTSEAPVVVQTNNTIVATLVTQTPASNAGVGPPLASSNTTSSSDTKSADSDSSGSKSSDKSAQKAESVDAKSGDAKNVTTSKMYCN